MAIKWTTKDKEINGSSNLHNRVRLILCTDPSFRRTACYQEVPVKDIIPNYPYNHRYDWYLQTHGIVIELHGIQHYQPQGFGNIGYDEKMKRFNAQKNRDSSKKESAIEAGFKYVEISYKEENKLDAEYFKKLIFGE